MRPQSLNHHFSYGIVIIFLIIVGCETPQGLRPTPNIEGTKIKFDLFEKDFPEIPLPNDIAMIPDPSSPTGLRLNLSLKATTKAEAKIREKANQLDGFSVFSPIIVSFEGPIDVKNIYDRHALNHDFSDDAVLLINIDKKSKGFGEIIPLDAGQGNFPIALEWPWQYWDFDEHSDSINLLFETHDEDLNKNGKLDPYEDIDFDGVLDKPNTFSGNDPKISNPDDLITFYEKETNTLILWPVVPLRQATKYAVVITKNLVDEKGKPVKSPFPYINILEQTPLLYPLEGILSNQGTNMTIDDVSFAWTFTTESVTSDLEMIRKGLYGFGSLKSLKDEFPCDIKPKIVRDKNEDASLPEKPYILPSDKIQPLFSLIGPILGYPQEVVNALEEDTKFTDYWVLGTFTTPYFLKDKDGMATPMYQGDEDESFDVDIKMGDATRGHSKVSFICSIPKETPSNKPPFPVVIYAHGFSGASFEIFGFAGRFARFGYALCGLDAVGHGLALPSDEAIPYDELIPQFLGPLGLTTFYQGFKGGRIRDLDNDGKITSWDNGGDFWVYDIFHMRDMVRQTVVDHMQFIRILRSLGSTLWKADTNQNGIDDDLMGDFNGDGKIDIQAENGVGMWGQSMGAIVTEVITAVEPAIYAATPISGGGGLIHIGIRSINPGVPEAVLMPLLGPFIVFTPLDDIDDTVEIAFMINHLHREYPKEKTQGRPHYYPFARTNKIKPGDRVIIRNLTNGETRYAFRPKDGYGFRVSLPADALSAMERRPLLGLKDGDTLPVPVTCEPDKWFVVEGANSYVDCHKHIMDRSLVFGDAIEIEIREGWDGGLKQVIDTFEMPVTYMGAVYTVGSPLVAIGTGLGRQRNSKEFRRLMTFAAMAIGKGDPISYARHYRSDEQLDFSYDSLNRKQGNIIIYHTIGDPNTPTATSLNLARAAGILDFLGSLETKNDRLLKGFVAEGIERFKRHLSSTLTYKDWADNNKYKDLRWLDEFSKEAIETPNMPLPVHADPDDLDNGINQFGEPSLGQPIRATIQNQFGYMGLRLPYTHPLGAHGVEPSNPTLKFNINNFVENQIVLFFKSRGTILSDDPCLEKTECFVTKLENLLDSEK